MPSPIDVVEAAYGTDGTWNEWMTAIAEAAAPLLDDGLGTYCMRSNVKGGYRHLGVGIAGVTAEMNEAMLEANRAADPRLMAELVSVPVTSLRHQLGRRFSLLADSRAATEPLGVQDILAITGINPDGTRVTLASIRTRPIAVRGPLIRTWSRVAAHLAAAARMVALHSTASRRFDGAEAIFDARGRIQHAVGSASAPDALGALREAALAVDWARGRLRRSNPDEALEHWRALFAARWSLVDAFDTDGRRFVIARENQPRPSPIPLLNARERQTVAYRLAGHPLKLIAYELGLSIPAVSRALVAARRKLGVRSDVELLHKLRKSVASRTKASR